MMILSSCAQCGQSTRDCSRTLCRLERNGRKVAYPFQNYPVPNCALCGDCVNLLGENDRLKGERIKRELESTPGSIYILMKPGDDSDYFYVRTEMVHNIYANALPLLDRQAWEIAVRVAPLRRSA